MPYLIDRQRALWSHDLVAILSTHQTGARSRVILTDNSLYHTLTRPRTFLRRVQGEAQVIETTRRSRMTRRP